VFLCIAQSSVFGEIQTFRRNISPTFSEETNLARDQQTCFLPLPVSCSIYSSTLKMEALRNVRLHDVISPKSEFFKMNVHLNSACNFSRYALQLTYTCSTAVCVCVRMCARMCVENKCSHTSFCKPSSGMSHFLAYMQCSIRMSSYAALPYLVLQLSTFWERKWLLSFKLERAWYQHFSYFLPVGGFFLSSY
jgi:hypothetical protein